MMQHTKSIIQNHQLFKNENTRQEYIDYMIKNGWFLHSNDVNEEMIFLKPETHEELQAYFENASNFNMISKYFSIMKFENRLIEMIGIKVQDFYYILTRLKNLEFIDVKKFYSCYHSMKDNFIETINTYYKIT